MRRRRLNLHASAAHRHNLGHQAVAPGTEVPMTRTLTCLVARAIAGPGSPTAQSGAGLQGSLGLRCRAGSSPCRGTDRPSTSYAAVSGGGARLGGSSAFTVEGRYIYGLTDLKLSTIASSESYKTRSFLILAGWAF